MKLLLCYSSIQRSWHPSGLCLPRKVTWLLINQSATGEQGTGCFEVFLMAVLQNGRINICFIVEESRLVWPSCCGLCWAVFRGTLGCVIVVGRRTFAELWGYMCWPKNSLSFDRWRNQRYWTGVPFHSYRQYLLQSRGKGRVSADCVLGVWRSAVVKFRVMWSKMFV